ncbi:MAG: Arm DNA-binding domain-containing protein [Jatrophihabitans sp.]|uniref:Arm DNA-binding domain-containing protein n=1 Tax=Jatrophihabitans sp. TaxID=1932789 RepID=UPI003F82361D
MTTGRKRRGHGEGSISSYRTNAGERFSIVYRAYDPRQGKVRQFRVRGFETRRAAQATLRERLRDIANGQHVAPDTETLAMWAERWLAAERNQVRPATWSSYSRNLRVHVVRGHEKVPTGGRIAVPTGGQLEVPTPRVSCPG